MSKSNPTEGFLASGLVRNPATAKMPLAPSKTGSNSFRRRTSPRRKVQRLSSRSVLILPVEPSARLSIKTTSTEPAAKSCSPMCDPSRLAPPTTTNLLPEIPGIHFLLTKNKRVLVRRWQQPCPGRFISCLAVSGASGRAVRQTEPHGPVKGRTRQFSHDSGCASAAALRFALCAYINNIRYIGTFLNADADVPAHFILFRPTFALIYPYQIPPQCRPMI